MCAYRASGRGKGRQQAATNHHGDSKDFGELSYALKDLLRYDLRKSHCDKDGWLSVEAVLTALHTGAGRKAKPLDWVTENDVQRVVETSTNKEGPRFEIQEYNRTAWIRATRNRSGVGGAGSLNRGAGDGAAAKHNAAGLRNGSDWRDWKGSGGSAGAAPSRDPLAAHDSWAAGKGGCASGSSAGCSGGGHGAGKKGGSGFEGAKGGAKGGAPGGMKGAARSQGGAPTQQSPGAAQGKAHGKGPEEPPPGLGGKQGKAHGNGYEESQPSYGGKQGKAHGNGYEESQPSYGGKQGKAQSSGYEESQPSYGDKQGKPHASANNGAYSDPDAVAPAVDRGEPRHQRWGNRVWGSDLTGASSSNGAAPAQQGSSPAPVAAQGKGADAPQPSCSSGAGGRGAGQGVSGTAGGGDGDSPAACDAAGAETGGSEWNRSAWTWGAEWNQGDWTWDRDDDWAQRRDGQWKESEWKESEAPAVIESSSSDGADDSSHGSDGSDVRPSTEERSAGESPEDQEACSERSEPREAADPQEDMEDRKVLKDWDGAEWARSQGQRSEDYLTLKRGELLSVRRVPLKGDDGWSFGVSYISGHSGYFPPDYAKAAA